MMFSQSSPLAPLALLISLATIIYGQELIDAPPVIISPANLDKPENLVTIGKISEQVNSLTCTASNAETVEWVYLDEANSQTYKVVSNNVWTVLPPDTDGDTGDVSRTITDQGMTNNAERSDQTGYYKCIAKTSVNGNDYVTTTPPIRFISPAVTMRGSYVPVRDSSVGQYSPHSLKCIADMEIKPNDLFDFNVIKFVWFRYGEQLQVIEEDTRVTINPKTGDLYFAYIKEDDSTGTGDGGDEYQCRIFVADQVQETIASRYKLAVTANGDDEPPYQLVYPKEYKDRKVSCIEGTDCTVTCIYAGRELGSDPPNPNFVPPSSTFITDYKGNNAEFQAIDDAEGKWQCNIDSDPLKAAEIDVEIRNYPSVPADNMADQFVEVGTDVEFECNADHINIRDLFFYYNGNLIQAPATPGGIGNPPHVNYKAGSTAIKISNAQRNHSSMVSCMAINSAGTKFKAAQLNIYDKPNITLSPATGYEITTDRKNTSIDYKFECMVEMDPKVTDATIHWRTNHTDVELSGQKITGEHDSGVKSVHTSKYNTITYQISSTLTFLVDLDTQDKIFGGHWECVVEFEIPGSAGDLISSSEPVPFTSAIANKGKVIAAAGFKDWWIIGVVVAIFFLLLLVILIVCCVKHHKGEQYYVDEKERMAGHNPEEEMGLYGFSDYKRPATGGYVPMYMSDQDPIKGSRTSMDMSDKPMESEGGSMDEYGDIDPGRFNEDGSFIGIYGKSSTNMDV